MRQATDDLDRMLVRLVRALRARPGADLARPCEVLELVQDVIPYRVLRREGAVDTNEDYEHALTRLLAGERGYLRGDPRMQQALTEELASPNPDTALFREFARNHVALTEVGVAAAGEIGEGSPALPSAVAVAQRTEPLAVDDTPPRRVSAVTAAFAGLDSLLPPEDDMSVAPPRFVTAQGVGGKCRYCAATLPDWRKIVFCPFCGNDLTMTQCPACSTELELGWKFCVTCGRSMAARATTGQTPSDTPAQGGP
ncbi:MAG: zinc ribbon domain-containing protein [Gemmatimonadetes bacterium]|nr:zinc ribbon domain-containing protein [Gemmatimonadota bacterium]